MPDTQSQTMLEYQFTFEEVHGVAIAALLHAAARKNYPSQYGLSNLRFHGNMMEERKFGITNAVILDSIPGYVKLTRRPITLKDIEEMMNRYFQQNSGD
ncbi:MAG: hypothetical protein IGS48_18385 [Oscillatoriales cyanobacterium C42_A2020_001]|nr:hypothetical protein [Leptolyngbyaceae cyanobacterium C42_A2020_001]